MRGYYSLDEKLECIEHGEVSLEEAYNLIDKYIEGQKEVEGIRDGEYVISKSSFGFYIDDKTSIEIFIYGENSYGLQFETAIVKKFLFFNYNSWYQEEITIFEKESLKEVVLKFFQYEPEEFRLYFEQTRSKVK